MRTPPRSISFFPGEASLCRSNTIRALLVFGKGADPRSAPKTEIRDLRANPVAGCWRRQSLRWRSKFPKVGRSPSSEGREGVHCCVAVCLVHCRRRPVLQPIGLLLDPKNILASYNPLIGGGLVRSRLVGGYHSGRCRQSICVASQHGCDHLNENIFYIFSKSLVKSIY